MSKHSSFLEPSILKRHTLLALWRNGNSPEQLESYTALENQPSQVKAKDPNTAWT